MPICTVCKFDKEPTEFHFNRFRKSGLQNKCKQCSAELFKKDYEARPELRAKIKSRNKVVRERMYSLLSRYKKFCGCKLCPENEPAALDLHHLDPRVKEDTIGKFLGCSMDRFRAEIRKCVVLCANCHRKVHAGILQLGIVAHG